jgi:hypothetical protein
VPCENTNNYVSRHDVFTAPATFQIVLRALQAVMSRATQDAIKIWGPNRNEWQKNLLQFISEDQLDPEFGGTREPNFKR